MFRWPAVSLGFLALCPIVLADPPRQAEPQDDGIELSIWVRNLDSERPRVRHRAYLAVLNIGPPARRALPEIIAAMKRPEYQAAGDTLLRLVLHVDPAGALPYVREWLAASTRSGRVQIGRAILKSEIEPLLPHLVTLLKDEDASMRVEAIHAIVELGDVARSVLPALKQAAADSNPQVRIEALTAVGQVEPKALGELIPQVLGTMRAGVINPTRAVEILRPFAGRAVAELVRELEDPAISGHSDLAAALIQLDASNSTHLIRNLGNPAPAIRLACVSALADSERLARTALPYFMIGLDDEDAVVRIHCVAALLSLDTKLQALVLPTLIDLTDAKEVAVRRESVQRLSDLGQHARPAIPALLAHLNENDPTVRLKCAEVLLRLDAAFGPTVVPALIRALKEPVNWGRRENQTRTAANLAGEVGPAAIPALPQLVRYFTHENRQVRLACAIAAVRISSATIDPAMAVFCELLTSKYDSTGLQAQVIHELIRLGPLAASAAPALTIVMESGDSSNQVEAAEALVRIGTDDARRAMDFLRLQLRSKGSNREESLAALRRLGLLAEPALPELIALLRAQPNDITRLAAEVVREIGPAARDAVPALEALRRSNSPALRSAAEQALQRITAAPK